MTEASYILVRLLKEFNEIESRNSSLWREHLGLILTNFHGAVVALTRMKHSRNVVLDRPKDWIKN